MADKEGKSKNGRLLRILKLVAKIDWKSMVVVLTIIGGAGGYLLDWIDDLSENRAQSGAYDLLAQRIDELYTRVETCETAHQVAEGAPEAAGGAAVSSGKGGKRKPTSKPPEAARVVPPLPASPHPDEPITMVETNMESAPPPTPVAYEKSRLPSFNAIQQKARQIEDMEDFMEDMKAR